MIIGLEQCRVEPTMASEVPNASSIEAELSAVQTVATALAGLSGEAQDRVIEFSLRMIGRAAPTAPLAPGSSMPAMQPDTPSAQMPSPTPIVPPRPVTDIRSLREAKGPRTANEMAALVAYYVSELAPEEDRKSSIATEDLEKYFKQAQYPLPGAMRVVLGSAKAAGYLDSADRGQYRLNPVGYNLVVHGLPAEGDSAARNRRRTAKKTTAKKTTAKKTTAKKTTAKRAG
jgi:hypothetical protein